MQDDRQYIHASRERNHGAVKQPERNKSQSAEVKDPTPDAAGQRWRHDGENLASDHYIRNIRTGASILGYIRRIQTAPPDWPTRSAPKNDVSCPLQNRSSPPPLVSSCLTGLPRKSHPETANVTRKSSCSQFGRDFCSSLDAPGAGEPVGPIFLSRLARQEWSTYTKRNRFASVPIGTDRRTPAS